MNPAAALEESERTSPGFLVSPRYRFGDLAVDLDSEDSVFVDRLSEIFGECAVERDSTRAAVLHCELRVLRESQAVLIRFGGQPEFDPVAFNLSLFSDGRYVEVPASLPGWRAIGPATDGRFSRRSTMMWWSWTELGNGRRSRAIRNPANSRRLSPFSDPALRIRGPVLSCSFD